jgi:hypothetical protein
MDEHRTRQVEYTTHLFNGWRRDLALKAGSGPGVYIARRGEKLIYIGKASSLANRLTQHHLNWLSCCTDMFPTHFDIIDTRTIDEATEIEANLIRSLRPPLNRRQEIGTAKKVHVDVGKSGVSSRGRCVRQIETGLFDGWYFLDDESMEEMRIYWQGIFPEYSHDIVGKDVAPSRMTDEKSINQSAAYQNRCIARYASDAGTSGEGNG